MKNAICLITVNPNKIWCDFLNNFQKYTIFIIIDNNNFDLSNVENEYKNINFVKIENKKCKLSGYIDSSFISFKKSIIGWDKGLYYFTVENLNYDFIWFLEDDVFFYNENTILNIDKQYINDDLLSINFDENPDGNKKDWLWNRINNINYSPPYYNGMICCVRFSKKMLNCISDYVEKNKTLFFIEAMFPTVAKKNNLKYSNPIEFNQIHWRYNFKDNEINKTDIFHPIKNINSHISFREKYK